MSNERDELKAHIHDSAVPRNGVYVLTEDCVADELLAAGYRKPQIVTTVEELDALPGGSIIRDSLGFAWQKYNRPISDKPAWFAATRDDGFYYSSNFIDGNRIPAMVLHIGLPR